MASTIQRQENGNIKLTITIDPALAKKTREEVIVNHVNDAELPGFRKGKAPRDMVEKTLDANHIKEDVLRALLPFTYSQAVSEHKLKPIVSPRIHVEALDDDKEWSYTAETAEMPEINLGQYKEEVKKLTAKSKIIVPGKEEKQVGFDEIVKVISEETKVTIPQIILDNETERLLAQTLDEVKRLGLGLDQYLASTGRTIEDLKKEYSEKARRDVTIEFALQKIADDEKINVTDADIDEAIKNGKTEEERKNLEQNRYLLASIIRQQKTLELLRTL